MAKEHLYYKNEAEEPEELEELEDDPEFKELGNDNLEETESPDRTGEDDASEEENVMPETE